MKLGGGSETVLKQPLSCAGRCDREVAVPFLKPFGDWSYLLFAPGLSSEDGGVRQQSLPVPKS